VQKHRERQQSEISSESSSGEEEREGREEEGRRTKSTKSGIHESEFSFPGVIERR
jgi:hypothetical protein